MLENIIKRFNLDEIIINTDLKANDTVYSDRLWEWDSKKYNELSRKYFGNEGQYFDGRSPKDIEKFLREYLGEEIILISIKREVNASHGYPYWRFNYYIERETNVGDSLQCIRNSK